MNKENKELLLKLLQEWFDDTDEQYRGKMQDKRWCLDKVGIYLKGRLGKMNHWKNGRTKKSRSWVKGLNMMKGN